MKKSFIIIFTFIIFIMTIINLKAENYAFLISAGQATIDNESMESDYWYDLYLAYEDIILKENYNPSNVIVFYGDGKDFATQYIRYKKEYHNWTNPIVDYDNNETTLFEKFSYYRNIITEKDNVLIWWVLGHGALRDVPNPNFDDYCVLLENQSCSQSTLIKSNLYQLINRIDRFNRRKIIWGTCQSGCMGVGAINFNNSNTTILTSSSPSEPSPEYTSSVGLQPHLAFNWCAISSLYGQDPLGNSYNADLNGDNLIDFYEIYENGETSSIMTNKPCIFDECPMEDYLFLNENLFLNNLHSNINVSYRVDNFTASNNVELMDNSNMTIACDKEIDFKSGFSADLGSTLHAYIGYINCSPGGKIPLKVENDAMANNFKFEIYPNPVSNNLSIEYLTNTSTIKNIFITNIYGMKIVDLLGKQKLLYNENKLNFDVSNLPNGLYFVTLISQDYTETKKFMVIH